MFHDYTPDRAEELANLRLAAAAPDLLAALKQIMEWEGYDHEAGYYPDEDTEQRASEVWDDAKAAIDKATGQKETACTSDDPANHQGDTCPNQLEDTVCPDFLDEQWKYFSEVRN